MDHWNKREQLKTTENYRNYFILVSVNNYATGSSAYNFVCTLFIVYLLESASVEVK